MPLGLPTAPGDVFPALAKGLRMVHHHQQLRSHASALALPAAPTVMKPHPLYTLGLIDMAAGKGLETATLGGWRYYLIENDQVKQAAEVVPNRTGAPGYHFASVGNGFLTGVEAALAKAESLPEVVSGNYELRSLEVPALYIVAFWLKDLTGDEDRFIVLPPVFPPFQALAVYTTAQLLQLLHQKAARKLPMELAVAPPPAPAKP